MKLQVNNSGAWTNVLSFNLDEIELVQTAVTTLGVCAVEAAYPVSFRIVDAADVVTHEWTHAAEWAHETQWPVCLPCEEALP